MGPKTKSGKVRHGEKLFDIADELFPRGAWWWWFWLFFFDNPKDPDRPRQLMILWSTKNVKEIDCNGLEIRLKRPIDRKNLDGAVAAWYFDGERMHHDFLLEQCHIRVSDDGLVTDSGIPTLFTRGGKLYSVQIGDGMEFLAEATGKHDFLRPNHHGNHFVGGMDYSITKINKLKLTGRVDGEPISGTAYFQRVFVNAPAVPWYWGIFHFEKGAVLTYTYQWIMKKKLKRSISLFDGERVHEFRGITVERIDGELPSFSVSGENEEEKINFLVEAYEHSSWTFKKRSLGIIPNKLVYNEYPAVIKGIELANKESGRTLTAKDFGVAVGNAEHTTGFLF